MQVTHTLGEDIIVLEGNNPRQVYTELCRKRGVRTLSELKREDVITLSTIDELRGWKSEEMATIEEILN